MARHREVSIFGRRALVIAWAAALAALSAAGCGGSSADSAGGTAPGSPPHVGKHLAIVEATTGDNYYMQVSCGAIEQGRRLGFKVDRPQGPKSWDSTLHAAVTSAVLARNPDALVYMPEDPKTGLPPVKAAAAQGLKIATVDQTLSDPRVVTSFVASDHYAGGQMAARELIRALGGKGKVLAEAHGAAFPITRARIGGFESVIKTAPGIEYLGAHYPTGDVDRTAADVAAVLRTHPDLAAVYTTDTPILQGVIPALREAGVAGKVKVVHPAADPYSIKALRAGQITIVLAEQPRVMGRMAVQQLANAIDGKPVSKEVHPSFTVITKKDSLNPKFQKLFYASSCR